MNSDDTLTTFALALDAYRAQDWPTFEQAIRTLHKDKRTCLPSSLGLEPLLGIRKFCPKLTKLVGSGLQPQKDQILDTKTFADSLIENRTDPFVIEFFWTNRRTQKALAMELINHVHAQHLNGTTNGAFENWLRQQINLLDASDMGREWAPAARFDSLDCEPLTTTQERTRPYGGRLCTYNCQNITSKAGNTLISILRPPPSNSKKAASFAGYRPELHPQRSELQKLLGWNPKTEPFPISNKTMIEIMAWASKPLLQRWGVPPAFRNSQLPPNQGWCAGHTLIVHQTRLDMGEHAITIYGRDPLQPPITAVRIGPNAAIQISDLGGKKSNALVLQLAKLGISAHNATHIDGSHIPNQELERTYITHLLTANTAFDNRHAQDAHALATLQFWWEHSTNQTLKADVEPLIQARLLIEEAGQLLTISEADPHHQTQSKQKLRKLLELAQSCCKDYPTNPKSLEVLL